MFLLKPEGAIFGAGCAIFVKSMFVKFMFSDFCGLHRKPELLIVKFSLFSSFVLNLTPT